jgi:transposase InsO family protein
VIDLSRSTYYYNAKSKSDEDLSFKGELLDKIDAIACEYPRYGYRRITKQLHRDGFKVNHKKVLRLMRENSLLCSVKRKWIKTTDSRHFYRRYPNLIKDKSARVPNQIWVSDITYIRINTGFVYLSVILDVYSRKVVGYAISRSLNKELAIRALESAIALRNPVKGCIHHSDQGIQYACKEYVDILEAKGFQISMSSKGNPYDNAYAESFFKTLKQEEVYLNNYQNFNDVAARIPYFIEEVYNAKRLHSSLGYKPPDEFEASYFNLHGFRKTSTLNYYLSV